MAANCPDLHALIAARSQGLPVCLLGIGTVGVAWARPALADARFDALVNDPAQLQQLDRIVSPVVL